MARRSDTRLRMVRSAIGLMQRNGAAAVTVDAVLTDSGAPRGSVYHHFSGGRDQIVAEALHSAGAAMTEMIRASTELPLDEAIDSFFAYWSQMLTSSDFTAGCPVAGAAVSGAESNPGLHDEVAGIFAGWHALLRDRLISDGVDPARARSLTTLVVAAAEGAIILSRIERSVTPLDDTAAEVRRLVAGVAVTA